MSASDPKRTLITSTASCVYRLMFAVLNNRRPSSDFVFDERRERLLSPSCLFRNVTAQVGKPTANFLVIPALSSASLSLKSRPWRRQCDDAIS